MKFVKLTAAKRGGGSAMSNIFTLIADTIADARNGAKGPDIRRWRSPFCKESVARDLVGLENTHDTIAQQGLRVLLHKIFKRD